MTEPRTEDATAKACEVCGEPWEESGTCPDCAYLEGLRDNINVFIARCQCTDPPCDGVLAGGFCDRYIYGENDE